MYVYIYIYTYFGGSMTFKLATAAYIPLSSLSSTIMWIFALEPQTYIHSNLNTSSEVLSFLAFVVL